MTFVVYFLICNAFISGVICILFAVKRALQNKLSGSAVNGETSSRLLDTSRQIGDFAVSVSHKTPSTVGYILCLL